MTKLDEIKQALAAYEAAKNLFRKAKLSHRLAGQQTAHKNLTDKRLLLGNPDYLRALVAVVDAAAEIEEPTVVTDGQTRMECACCGNRIRGGIHENQHKEDCSWLILQKALKALE